MLFQAAVNFQISISVYLVVIDFGRIEDLVKSARLVYIHYVLGVCVSEFSVSQFVSVFLTSALKNFINNTSISPKDLSSTGKKPINYESFSPC